MKWVSTLSYLPINYSAVLAKVQDCTQKVLFDNNLNGDRIRVCLSNRYSKKPLVLAGMTVGIERDGEIETVKKITLNGNNVICLEAGEERYSDEIAFPVAAGDKIAVFSYIEEQQEIGSICALWSKTGALVSYSASGDFTDGTCFESVACEDVYEILKNDPGPVKGMFFYGFSGVQVLTQDSVKTIAAFGDSITHMSYVTNALYKRLYKEYPGKTALINCGIGGNRLLHDATYAEVLPGQGSCFGEAGLKRFEADVFGEETVDAVLVLEGINDIMHPVQFSVLQERVTPKEMEDGYRELASIAHRHGARIFGATITPCGNPQCPDEWMEEFETLRTGANERIRTGLDYDGYFDYEAAVEDEGRPGYMKAEYHIGDGLHPNDAGGAAMAAQVDFKQLLE